MTVWFYLFLGSGFIVLYNYAGYALIVILLNRIRRRPTTHTEHTHVVERERSEAGQAHRARKATAATVISGFIRSGTGRRLRAVAVPSVDDLRCP